MGAPIVIYAVDGSCTHISLLGALPWATTAIGEAYGCAVWYVVAGATAILTAASYIGYAAINAAVDNIQNIACIDHTKQYFVCKSIQFMAGYISHYCIGFYIWYWCYWWLWWMWWINGW